MVGAPIT